jgi:A/G-specific adenine glycosylase
MLQQTTVKAVLPYYAAFLARFPTVEDLAAAREDDVLEAWSGLGYYQRARNLHRGAAHILDHHGGRFPHRLQEALEVPGVGRYTAAAVLSIAYGVPVAAVDGNVRRVLSRLFARTEHTTDRDLQTLADALLPRGAPGDWNQALMDLGATVCTPKSPSCGACPVSRQCRATATGRPEAFGPASRRPGPVDVRVVAFLCVEAGRILLVRTMSATPASRFWELPQTPLDWTGATSPSKAVAARYGLRIAAAARLVEVRHTITHHRIRAEARRGRLVGPLPADPEHVLWAEADRLSDIAVSGITRKLVAAVRGLHRPVADGLDSF